MLYTLLKIPAQFAIKIYCRKIIINNRKILSTEGPLLIASNHPNSFLDAIIVATLFKKPVYSLARGDSFKNKFYASLLRSLKMFPVYRISEGVENLEQNYLTFEKCKDVFRKNGIVLIFSEGRCVNEWKLRPLKKGTARLAMSSWQDEIDLKIIPLGINYQSFTSFGKNIRLNFGNILTEADIADTNGYGNTINDFNTKLQQDMKNLVFEAGADEKTKIQTALGVQQPLLKKIALSVPATAGFLAHALLYLPLRQVSWKKASHVDHYDSVLVGLLFILYPIYLLTICLVISSYFGLVWALVAFLVLPCCAWSFVQLKKQF